MILPISHTIETASDIAISQVAEEIPLYIINIAYLWISVHKFGNAINTTSFTFTHSYFYFYFYTS